MRLSFLKTNLTHLILHAVGNKVADEGVVISKSPLSLSEDLKNILTNFFLKSFNTDRLYCFYHDYKIDLNEVYLHVSNIFDNPDFLCQQSIYLAKLLYNKSVHPQIKSGEFYVAYFKDIEFEGHLTDAIGLFKTEKKDIFLKPEYNEGIYNLKSESGINTKKIDKGCIVINNKKEEGYICIILDLTNKGNDAQYWADDFLHVHQITDTYTNTENIMSLAKSFVKKELTTAKEVTKTEQIDILNKSLQYFKEKESFNITNFEEEVIINPTLVEKFREYKREYESIRNISIDNEFPLSESAIKKQQRSYKRAITLDKKIQIIINGDSDQIERGVDSKGNFYKIYYNNED